MNWYLNTVSLLESNLWNYKKIGKDSDSLKTSLSQFHGWALMLECHWELAEIRKREPWLYTSTPALISSWMWFAPRRVGIWPTIKQHTVAEGQVLKRTQKTVSGQQSQQLEEWLNQSWGMVLDSRVIHHTENELGAEGICKN